MENNKKIKVLIATGIYPPEIGGPSTYSNNIKKELIHLGCVVNVLTFSRKKNGEEYDQGVNISFINSRSNIILRYVKYFLKCYFLARKADIIYILDIMSVGLPSVITAQLLRKKVVFRTGGDFLWEKAFQKDWTSAPLCDYYGLKKNFQERIFYKLTRTILNRTDIIIFSTRFQADIYRKYYKIPDTKIRFIPNAMPSVRISGNDDRYKDHFLFAGRFIKIKNIISLLEAFAEIDHREKLLLVGSGPELTIINDRIKDLNLKDRVKIINNLKQEDLFSIINSCKLYILPSVTEISPNIVMECVSIKHPIIFTKNTGLEKEFTDNLITFDPASKEDMKNKINYLLDPDNMKNYKDKIAKLEIPKREWSDLAKEHLEIFRELL